MKKCNFYRLFDFLFSILFLTILSPLFLPVLLILRFSGEGEVFYFQERVGKDNQLFKLIKFATMLKNSASLFSGTITIKNDPRVLPIGKFLRKSKINEIPQLINILVGHMSFVGPRPLTKETFNFYSKGVKREIKDLKPGLTGLGSLFFYNEEDLITKNHDSKEFYKNIIAPYKGKLEVWFKNNMSLKNYFLIIILTIYIVISKNNLVIFKVFKNLPKPNSTLLEIMD